MPTTTSTSRALATGDLVYLIFEHFAESTLHAHLRSRRKLSTLFDLACTCRAFRYPALRVLWRELYGLRPLLRLLSCIAYRPPIVMAGDAEFDSDLAGGIESAYRVHGDMEPGQWERFRYYAAFVQSLLIRLEDYELIGRSIISFVCDHNGGDPLLPNLRNLHWSVPVAMSKYLPVDVIGPSLRHAELYGLKLDIPSQGPFPTDVSGPQLTLHEIITKVPHLQSLHVAESDAYPTFINPHMTHASRYRATASLCNDSFADLSDLASLTEFGLRDIGVLPDVQPRLFPHLEVLRIEHDPSAILGFFRAAILPSLCRCTIVCYAIDASYLSDWLSQLGLSTSPSVLRHLKLHVLCKPTISYSSLLSVMRPPLGLARLERLEMDLFSHNRGAPFTLSEDDLLTLWTAFPNLTHLILFFAEKEVSLSFRSLHYVAQHCVRLQALVLPSLKYTCDVRRPTPLEPHGLQTLHILTTLTIADEDIVIFARDLAQLFPKLISDTEEWLQLPEPFCRYQSCEKWADVEAALREIWLERSSTESQARPPRDELQAEVL